MLVVVYVAASWSSSLMTVILNKKREKNAGWGNGEGELQCTTKNIIALMKELND